MLPTKLLTSLILRVGLIGLIAVLAACNSVGKRKENITPLAEAERQTSTDYADAYDNPQYADGEQTIEVESNNTDAAEQELNPYDNPQYAASVAESPVVTGQQDSSSSAVETDVNGVPVVEVVRKLTLEERFGPNPYLSNPPQLSPEVSQAFTESIILMQSGDEEAGVSALKTLNDEQPLLSGPAYNLGYYYYQKGQLVEAKQYLEIALSRNYNNLNARNLTAKIYRDESEFDKAEKEYLTLIGIWGAYLPAYKNLGIMYDLYMGQFAKALNYYQQYNELNPEEDRQVKGWALVMERKLKAQQRAAAAKAEQAQASQLDQSQSTASGGQ